MDTVRSRALPARRKPRSGWVAVACVWAAFVTLGLGAPWGQVWTRFAELERSHSTTFGTLPSPNSGSYGSIREDDPGIGAVAWPALRPSGVACRVKVVVVGGELVGTRISGCHTEFADAVQEALVAAEWPEGDVEATWVARAPVTPLSSLGTPAPWVLLWEALLVVPALAIVMSILWRWRAIPGLTPLQVARDRSRPLGERAVAVHRLVDHGDGPDLLLDAAREFMAVPELAAVVVEGVRRRPSAERLRMLSSAAERRWDGWADEVRDDAAWVLVQDLCRSPPELPGAQAGLLVSLAARDPEVRRLAVERLAEVGTVAAIPALRRLGPPGRVAIERIAARAGIGPGDVALAEGQGQLSVAEGAGELTEAE